MTQPDPFDRCGEPGCGHSRRAHAASYGGEGGCAAWDPSRQKTCSCAKFKEAASRIEVRLVDSAGKVVGQVNIDPRAMSIHDGGFYHKMPDGTTKSYSWTFTVNKIEETFYVEPFHIRRG